MPTTIIDPNDVEDDLPEDMLVRSDQGAKFMPRMRKGIPVGTPATRIPDPISGLEGEGDTTGLTVARQPTFMDRVGSRLDQNLNQLPQALLRTVTGHATKADNQMGAGISDSMVGNDSDSAVKRMVKSATILPRMAIDTVRGAVRDPAGGLGDLLSGVVGEEALGGRGRGTSSVEPGVEAEAGATNSGSIRSGPGGSGTRMTVPPGSTEGVTNLLKRVGDSKVSKFVLGHRGSIAMDALNEVLGGGKGSGAATATEAPLPHASAGKGVHGSLVQDWGGPTRQPPANPTWQSRPDLDVSEGGHSVQSTVADQASTAGQQGSVDRIPNAVEMSPAPAKLVRRSGLNPDSTSVRPQSAIPSPEYDPNIGVGPKAKDIGAAARADQPPIPRGNKRVRVRSDREVQMQGFWDQARREAGGDKVEGQANGQGKVAHTGVGDISSASTDQIATRANELYAQSKLKRPSASVTKVPSSGVGSVGDINPHPRKYYPENPDAVTDDTVNAALKLKRRR